MSKAHCRMGSSGQNELGYPGEEERLRRRNLPGARLVPATARVAFEGQYALGMAAKSKQMCQIMNCQRGTFRKACRVCAWAACPPSRHPRDMPSQPGLLAALPGEDCAFCRRGPKLGSLPDLGTQFQCLSKNLNVPKSKISFPKGGTAGPSHAFKNC